MILHLIEDDHFSPYAIKQFTAGSEEINKFLLIIPEPAYEIKYIKSLENVIVLVFDSHEYQCFVNNLGIYKAIITHNLLTKWKAEIIQRAPDFIKVAWVFWGSELYSRRDFTRQFLGNDTKKRYNKHIYKQKIKTFFYQLLFKKKYLIHYEVPKDVFQKVTYCLTDVSEDAKEAEKYFNTSFLPLWYNYYSIEETIGSLLPDACMGSNILVGNSASITNNHIEIIKLLGTLSLEKRKIIIPLSYGDNYVIPIVKKCAQKILNGNFIPIDTYMAREEYNEIIKDCCVAIFNHHRPQALGNIITSLWLGARVYLSKRSLLYSYFKKNGVHLYSVEDHLRPDNKSVFEQLPRESVNHNRTVLQSIYGREAIQDKVQLLIAQLSK